MTKRITTFTDLTNKIKELDYELDDFVLTKEETEALTKEIDKFKPSVFEEIHRITEKYYSLSVPEQLIKDVLKSDLDLAREAHQLSIGDTAPREILMEQILKHMGLSSWPCNGDSREYKDKFLKDLESKMGEFGVSFVEEKPQTSTRSKIKK